MTITVEHRSSSPAGTPHGGQVPAEGPSPDRGSVAPRWARRAATLAVLTTLPSATWRVAMVLGVPVGVDEQVRREQYSLPGWGTLYVLGLDLLLVGLALLTLGLVQRWGEVTPRWMPFLGGRRVPPLAAVIPAGVGSVALTWLWVTTFLNFDQIGDYYGLYGVERAVVLVSYSPLLLWGPLLAAVTVSYARRRRPLSAVTSPDGRALS